MIFVMDDDELCFIFRLDYEGDLMNRKEQKKRISFSAKTMEKLNHSIYTVFDYAGIQYQDKVTVSPNTLRWAKAKAVFWSDGMVPLFKVSMKGR